MFTPGVDTIVCSHKGVLSGLPEPEWNPFGENAERVRKNMGDEAYKHCVELERAKRNQLGPELYQDCQQNEAQEFFHGMRRAFKEYGKKPTAEQIQNFPGYDIFGFDTSLLERDDSSSDDGFDGIDDDSDDELEEGELYPRFLLSLVLFISDRQNKSKIDSLKVLRFRFVSFSIVIKYYFQFCQQK